MNIKELGKQLDELTSRKTELNDLIADALLAAETGDMVAMAQVAALKKERGDLNDLISDTESLIIRLTTVEAEQRRSNRLAELKARIEDIQKLPEEVKSDLDKVDNALANLAQAWGKLIAHDNKFVKLNVLIPTRIQRRKALERALYHHGLNTVFNIGEYMNPSIISSFADADATGENCRVATDKLNQEIANV
ncbi:hypothetical protein EK556_13020 [Salmonella enterica]|nr:hypothetical protein [Salmonella enterica]ELV9466872.1 hypothetical protein [Salmonella enterica]